MLPPESFTGDRSRPSGWEWVQVALLVVNLGWTIACLGGFRAETMVVSSALMSAVLVVNLTERVFSRRVAATAASSFLGFHPAGWYFVPFLIYAAANVRWVTPVPWLGWQDWWGWAHLIAIFWVVLNGVRSRPGRAVVAGALIAFATASAAAALYQRFGDHDWLMLGRHQTPAFIGRSSGSFGIPNSLAGLLILLIPPVVARVFQRSAGAAQRILFGYISLVLTAGLILTISRGAWLSLGIVLVAWPLFSIRGSRRRRFGMTSGIALVLVALATLLFFKVPLVHERMTQLRTHAGERSRPILWRAAGEIYFEAPVWGGGAGSYNLLFDRHRPEDFQDEPLWAHNDYLNTLSDYGAVGFLFFFGAVGFVGWKCIASRRSNSVSDPDTERSLSGASTAGLTALALQLALEFHLKIPALAMAVAITAALVTQALWRGPVRLSGSASRSRVFTALIALAVVIATVTALAVDRAEALRQAAHESFARLISRALLTEVKKDLSQAAALNPGNGFVWADLALADALQVRFEPQLAAVLGRESEIHADRALGCSTAVPEFWIRRGVARDLQGRSIEAGRDYVHAVKLAPTKASVWYFQALHLSLDDRDASLAAASVAYALRLDPGNRDAQALAQRLAIRSRAP